MRLPRVTGRLSSLLAAALVIALAAEPVLAQGELRFERSVTNAHGRPRSVFAGDYDNDGVLDLALALIADHRVVLLLGNGDGTFVRASTTSDLPPEADPISMLVRARACARPIDSLTFDA
jgi:hypothetical protein